MGLIRVYVNTVNSILHSKADGLFRELASNLPTPADSTLDESDTTSPQFAHLVTESISVCL